MAPSNLTAWHRGQRVLAQWQLEAYSYPSTITGYDENTFLIQFDDGDRVSVTADQFAVLDIGAGSRVFGRWQGGAAYYAGTVDPHEGAALHITYDDGEEEGTTVGMVRVER